MTSREQFEAWASENGKYPRAVERSVNHDGEGVYMLAITQTQWSVWQASRAQAFEDGAKACDSRYMGDHSREDMEARTCAEVLRAMKEAP